MKNLPYPRGAAREIADARAKGFKPAGAVEVVLAGGWFGSENPVVYADHDQTYRWDWVAGLSVVLLIDSTTSLDRIFADVDRANPGQIDVIDRVRRLGWMITATKPRIKTMPWPRPWVEDWLDGGNWHLELAAIKADAFQSASPKHEVKTIFEPEAIWN